MSTAVGSCLSKVVVSRLGFRNSAQAVFKTHTMIRSLKKKNTRLLFHQPVQLLGRDPLPERRTTPFLPTRMPSHLCLRRRCHPRGPRNPPTPGTRSVLSSLLSSPRYNSLMARTWKNVPPQILVCG